MLKINSKYEPLWREGTRYYVCTGGRGSAKSFSVGTYLTQKTFETDNKILFTRYTMASAHSSIIPEFEEKIDVLNAQDYFNVNKTDITNTETESSVLFKGLKTSSGNQTAALKSLQGVTVWVLDEAEELDDESMFDKIDMSIRKKGKNNIVILILNPTTKEHWIYKRFFEEAGVQEGWNGTKSNVTYIHTTYLDNIENLSQSFLDRVEQIKLNNPEKYKHVVLGGWLDKAEGVIYSNWEYGKFPDDVDYGYGLDFGYSVDPDSLTKIYVDNKRKEVFVKQEIYTNGLRSAELEERMIEICGKDKEIIADAAEDRLIADLQHAGLQIYKCTKGAGSINAGIVILQGYKIIVDPDSIEIAKELNNYVWNNRGKPVDAYNHALDEIRYYVADKSRQSMETFTPSEDIYSSQGTCDWY